MRRQLTIAAAAILAACSSETVGPPPPAPVNWQSFSSTRADAGSTAPTAKESAIAEQYAAALSSPAISRLGHLFDGDAHFAFPGRNDARGRDDVVRAHDSLFGAFAQRSLAVSRVWRTASEQTLEWTMSGVQDGDWLDVPATHKPVSFRGLTLLWTTDEGTISDCHVYFDVAVVKALLGKGPKDLAGLSAPSSPTGPPQVFDQTGLEPDNVAVVRTSLDALENDPAAYLASTTDDAEVQTLERAEPIRGKDALLTHFKAMHKAVSQLDTTVDTGWSVARFAIVEYTIDGEQLGPLGWIQPHRDRVIRLHIADVSEVRDGKIARTWRYDNPSEIEAPGP